MSKKNFLVSLMRMHSSKLTFTYLLFLVEMTGMLLRPYFLGMAVNDLLAYKYDGLLYLVVQHVVWLIVSTVRRTYDTRVFTGIYNQMALTLLKNGKTKDTSKLAAHTNLTQEFITFLEFDFTFTAQSIFNIAGALIMLYFFEPRVMFFCLLLVVPSFLANYFSSRRLVKLTKLKNDELEKQVDVITENNPLTLQQHFDSLKKWNIKISDNSAWTFGIIEIFVIIILTLSLLILNDGARLRAGDILSIYNYVLMFIGGMDRVPYMVQRLSLLSDLSKRINYEVGFQNKN